MNDSADKPNPIPSNPETGKWRARRLERRLERLLPWEGGPVRPAEVIDALQTILLDRISLVEDANYRKHAPNHFVVELGESNYYQNYQPIEARVVQQWQERLQEHLNTANSRQGRLVYRLGGPLKVEIRPSNKLAQDEARVLYRLDPESSTPRLLPACLEQIEDGKRWRLHDGIVTLGRDSTNDIHLDRPHVQARRLVSSRHAYIVCQNGHYMLYDGDPGGTPSVNGTYVNQLRIPPGGQELLDGDLIILASLVPNQPRSDTPGTSVLRFHLTCPEA
jgi:hypothetical protein